MSTTQHSRVGRPDADDVLTVIREALATVLECDSAAVHRGSLLSELAADSLALVEVAEIVEERLERAVPGLHIPDADLDGFVTVGDAVDFVMDRL